MPNLIDARRSLSLATLPLLANFSAGPVATHKTETVDTAWDAAANEKKLPSPMPVATAKAMYAWIDTSKIKDGKIAKDACKFPHHEVSTDGKPGAANIKACQSAIGAVNGARQKPDIPDKDRKAVYDHLAAHLKAADVKPADFKAALPSATLPHAGKPTAGDDGCECSCTHCQDGDCSECTNKNCDDENCEDCPMQEGGAHSRQTLPVPVIETWPAIAGLTDQQTEVMRRIGCHPALISMSSISDQFGDSAPYRIENCIALISITGPLSNSPWSWGGTTYGNIQNQCKVAMADPDVKGVLLCVNSPGGEADNAFETAACIAEMAAVKPCYAAVNTMAYSGAYMLACQAQKIFCPPVSGGCGSIGIFGAHFDISGMLEQAGIKATLFSAGEGKTDGTQLQPLTDSAKESIQANMDRLYDEFTGLVAQGRGMTQAKVVALGARQYQGAQAAIASGLADMPGDVNDAWTALCAAVPDEEEDTGQYPLMQGGRRSVASATNSNKEQHKMETNKPGADAAVIPATAEDLEKLITQAREEGNAQAGLVASMCAIAGAPEKAADFIRLKKSPKDVAEALMAAKVEADAQLVTDPTVRPADQTGKSGAGAMAPTAFGTPLPWAEIVKKVCRR